MKIIDSSSAIGFAERSLANVQKVAQKNEEADFGAVLSELAGSTIASLHKAEDVSLAALRGTADPRLVVESVMQAEQSLQTSLAVRDKLVAAFQEISRMSI